MTLSLSTVRATRRSAAKAAPFVTYLSVWQQRRALAGMDVTRLAEMGITPAQAAREAARPFWDLP